MSDTLIELSGVSKSYPVLDSSTQKLRYVWACLRRRPSGVQFDALKDVSLTLRRGASLGIIGANGAGKSTLLKIVAGVVQPTVGTVRRNARVGALLELGAGFHPEYSGMANIHLACAMMGMTRTQTLARLDYITSFADIGAHIHQPIKHYSSGMVVRLGFAVATSVTPDVLITDEVLAVGDESFQRKCIAWLDNYRANGGTVLLCSHSMYHIQKICQTAIWLEGGRERMQGDAATVANRYLAWHEERGRLATSVGDGTADASGASMPAGEYAVKALTVRYGDGDELVVAYPVERVQVRGVLTSPDGRAPHVAVGIVRADGTPVFGVVSEAEGWRPRRLPSGDYAFGLDFQRLPLLPGRYVLRAHAMDPEGMRLFPPLERTFDVGGSTRELGYCHIAHNWQGMDSL